MVRVIGIRQAIAFQEPFPGRRAQSVIPNDNEYLADTSVFCKGASVNQLSTSDSAHSPSEWSVSLPQRLDTDADTAAVRCLHIINGEHFSGAERVQDLLALSLAEYGFEVEFAVLKEGKFAANRRSQCPIHSIPMSGRFDRTIVRRLQELVRQRDYRILHAHTPRSLMVAAAVARRTGLPLVYHVHSPVGRDSTRWFQNRINLWVEKRSLQRTTHLIGVSDSVGHYMEQLGYGSDRLTVVPNGVPVVETENTAGQNSQPTWSSPWATTLGTVALFRPRKGTEVLLRSVARMAESGRDIGLVAVGGFESPSYQKMLEQLTSELNIQDRVHWTGFTRDVNAWFPVMDLFVLPSLFGEGLPMVVLESMAMGIPVVASRVEGIEQAIRPGLDGAIAEPGNAEDLALQVTNLLDQHDLTKLGAQARNRQREQFSDHSMCRQTAAVYRRVLNHRRHGNDR